jgi:hypothetical protein
MNVLLLVANFETGCRVTEIGTDVFHGCGIASIQFPSNVAKLGDQGFYLCCSLCTVKFQSGSKLQEIGNEAFSVCNIKSIEIPSNVAKLGDRCFFRFSFLENVIFEPGSEHREIGDDCFSRCPLRNWALTRESHANRKGPTEFQVESENGPNGILSKLVMTLSEYTVVKTICKRGSEKVILVENRTKGRQLAVKYIARGSDSGRQIREVCVLAELRHPCIVRVVGLCLPNHECRRIRIAMEYASNGSGKML